MSLIFYSFWGGQGQLLLGEKTVDLIIQYLIKNLKEFLIVLLNSVRVKLLKTQITHIYGHKVSLLTGEKKLIFSLSLQSSVQISPLGRLSLTPRMQGINTLSVRENNMFRSLLTVTVSSRFCRQRRSTRAFRNLIVLCTTTHASRTMSTAIR